MITPTDMPAGTYRVGWNYEWAQASTQAKFRARVRVDDLDPNLLEHQEEPTDAGNDNYAANGGHGTKTLVAGSHTIVFAIASTNVAQQSVVWNSRLEFWRVF
jgi:hypothetical protein